MDPLFAPPSDTDDPLALLMACHQRIRRYTDGVRRLAGLRDLADSRAAPTAAACLRYFEGALLLHAEDEERSLLPRLRALEPDEALLEAISLMSTDHAEIERGLPELCALLRAVAEGRPCQLDALRASSAWLSDVLITHIDEEERLIFPAAEAIGAKDRAAMAREIRARRVGPATTAKPGARRGQ